MLTPTPKHLTPTPRQLCKAVLAKEVTPRPEELGPTQPDRAPPPWKKKIPKDPVTTVEPSQSWHPGRKTVEPSQSWHSGPHSGLPPAYEEDGKVFTVLEAKELDPLKVRFSQRSVNKQFTNGQTLTGTCYKIATGKMLSTAIPPIRVVHRSDGSYMSHDNRRLLILKWLAEEGWLETITVHVVDTPIPLHQLTTTNDGMSTFVHPRQNFGNASITGAWQQHTPCSSGGEDRRSL